LIDFFQLVEFHIDCAGKYGDDAKQYERVEIPLAVKLVLQLID